MAFDFEFFDGFDSYGVTGYQPVVDGSLPDHASLIGNEWTSLWVNGSASTASFSCTVVDPLSPTGQALSIEADSSSGQQGISKTLPGSYARLIGGVEMKVGPYVLGRPVGICFGDIGADQIAITVEPSGQIGFRIATSPTTSALGGTLIAASDESVTAGRDFYLEWDVTIDATGGIVKAWINGRLTSLSLTGQNTQATVNATANQVRLMASGSGAGMIVDNFYLYAYTASGGGAQPLLSNPVVETAFPIADEAIDFAFGAAILGADYSATTATNAPGANQLFLRSYTPDVAGSLDAVAIVPAATSVAAKFKAVAYADVAGAPVGLLSDGVEVIGGVSGDALTSALNTPQALVAGTPVWIGFLVDTSVALQKTDDTTLGRKIARTYGSGAPATAGAMTPFQPSWVIFGVVSGVATDAWSLIDNNPHAGDLSYMTSATPGDEDLYAFPALATTPTVIYSLAVKIVVRRTDAGARTLDLRVKSAATTGSGDNAGQAPGLTYETISSYFELDPDTAAAWNASGVNLAKAGYKIAT